MTNLEVIKLTKVTLDGSENWVISVEDFTRLMSKHKLTLQQFRDIGLSRSLWDNTISYHGWDRNKLEDPRQRPFKESKHGNTAYGFSSTIPITHPGRVRDSRRKEYINHIDGFFPGFLEKYSTYHEDVTSVSLPLSQILRQVLELQGELRAVHHRLRKYAMKVGLTYHKLLHNKLNYAFAKILDELSLEYPLEYKVGDYFFDFYLPTYGIYIEVDGGGHLGTKDIAKPLAISEGEITKI